MSAAGIRSHTAHLLQHSNKDQDTSQALDPKSKFQRNIPATIYTQDSDATLDVETDSKDGSSLQQPPKKVNFWGWVDVGFSYSAEDYDRKPATVEPLTKDGAMEVMEMRCAMKRISDVMYKWRYDYENNISGAPFRSDQLSVQNRSNACQTTVASKDAVHAEPMKTMKMQPNSASVPMHGFQTKGGANSTCANLNRGVGARFFKTGCSNARKWAWEDQTVSTNDSQVMVSGKSCQVGRGKR
ncbi:hypothetical protein HDU80_008917 [Chytriomyces hyalinus]|nr:hypothetical protein HDU80_008917 [Chytriomyces hyalinus]